jgi:release factor glutamine methyltransferase
MLKNILISKLFDLDLVTVALGNYTLNVTQQIEIEAKVAQLNSGVPVDYLVGKVKILGLDLIVNEHTLIPREETEFWLQQYKSLIFEKVKSIDNYSPLEGWQAKPDGVDKSDVLQSNNKKRIPSQTLIDLGTGTGIIGLYLSGIYDKVYLLDIEKETLEVTKQNITLNQKTNCQTLLSNGLVDIEKLIVKNEKWDLVANLPYLPSEDILRAKEYKVEHEPAIALYSGNDGLKLFNIVLQQIKAMKNKPVNVLFELDPRNIKQAQTNLNKLSYQTEIWLDQNCLQRVLVGTLSLDNFALSKP